MDRQRFQFLASEKKGKVSAIFIRPQDAKAVLIIAHGAGAGMEHPFMENISLVLADHQVATLRFNFPYMERGKGGLDGKAVLKESIQSAIKEAHRLAEGLPVFAGGKSMGGRITSMLAAELGLGAVKGIVFWGFPLHAAGKASRDRADHLYEVPLPMLFLQGTRDKLASLELLQPEINKLGEKAHLYISEGGDHSFKTLKRSGISEETVMTNLVMTVEEWMDSILIVN